MGVSAPPRPRSAIPARPMSARPRALGEWLTDLGEPVDGALRVSAIPGGDTNESWVVVDRADRRWVLRERAKGDDRPFHREAAVLVSLAGSGVPVPGSVGHGRRRGGCFMVTRFVSGAVLDCEHTASQVLAEHRQTIGISAIDTLSDLHSIAPAAVGLPDFAMGHLDRQLAVLSDLWARTGSGGGYDSSWRAVRTRLLACRPAWEGPAQLVHGDFRLPNLVVSKGRAAAVLDWERCTSGNAMSDLAWLLNSWRHADEPSGRLGSPTRVGGFCSRDELAQRYAVRTALNPYHLSYYRAFAHWTAATLLQASATRRRTIQDSSDHDKVLDEIQFSLLEASTLLRRPAC
ncbi:Phosphotransferase enzyme family protein [Mycobacterium sp. THAF192]|nr:Phosphotransferase enzyme family protein [Mycobacterium sp. THAF192]